MDQKAKSFSRWLTVKMYLQEKFDRGSFRRGFTPFSCYYDILTYLSTRLFCNKTTAIISEGMR